MGVKEIFRGLGWDPFSLFRNHDQFDLQPPKQEGIIHIRAIPATPIKIRFITEKSTNPVPANEGKVD
jgi:hypothetical protein